jgi:hypothetical protein
MCRVEPRAVTSTTRSCGGPPRCAGAAGAGARLFSGCPAAAGRSWAAGGPPGGFCLRLPEMCAARRSLLSHDNQDRLGSSRRGPSIP